MDSIKVGVLLKDKNIDKLFLINNLIILCKHFMHRCEYLKAKPHFSGWKIELKIFAKFVSKTETLINSYHLNLFLLIE